MGGGGLRVGNGAKGVTWLLRCEVECGDGGGGKSHMDLGLHFLEIRKRTIFISTFLERRKCSDQN